MGLIEKINPLYIHKLKIYILQNLSCHLINLTDKLEYYSINVINTICNDVEEKTHSLYYHDENV